MLAEEWFNNLPIVTKYYLVAALGSTLLTHFGLLDVRLLIWQLSLVMNKFQVRRSAGIALLSRLANLVV
jgi:hypothetical protein